MAIRTIKEKRVITVYCSDNLTYYREYLRNGIIVRHRLGQPKMYYLSRPQHYLEESVTEVMWNLRWEDDL